MASIRIEPLGRAELKFARFTVSAIHMHEVGLDEEDKDKPAESKPPWETAMFCQGTSHDS
jgi:hypothetical protein